MCLKTWLLTLTVVRSYIESHLESRWKWHVCCKYWHFINSNRCSRNDERQYILDVVLAEASSPVSIFLDKYSEELTYPGICWDLKRSQNNKRLAPVHYREICKSELRRGASKCVENLFFKNKETPHGNSFGEVSNLNFLICTALLSHGRASLCFVRLSSSLFL